MDYERRRDRVARQIRKAALDGLLVTSFTNVTYLTGFTGDDSYLLLTPERAVMLSDARYEEQIHGECPGLPAEIRRPPMSMTDLVARVCQAVRLRRLGFEADAMTVSAYEQLSGAVPQAEWVPTTGWVAQWREIKDKDEIACIRRSIDVAQRSFRATCALLRPDVTELQVARDLEYQIRTLGGQGCAFPPIIAAGPRAALPHARPGPNALGSEGFVLFDWGARVDGYTSDLTRVVSTTRISPKLERLYGVVLRAQERAIAAVRAGARMSDVDRAARGSIERDGFGKRFGHGLGHGFGLEIHEQPRLAPEQDRLLRAGMVITIEPGVYLPGWGGVRIEDDLLVTRSGCEVLTSLPKQLEECAVTWAQ